MDELESTLRIRVDRTELDEALRMIREDLERSVTVSFTKALREARAAVGGAAGTGSGGPGAGPAPASSANPSERRSRRRGGGASDGSGVEDAPPEPTSSASPDSGSGASAQRPRDARGRFVGPQATSSGAIPATTAGDQFSAASQASENPGSRSRSRRNVNEVTDDEWANDPWKAGLRQARIARNRRFTEGADEQQPQSSMSPLDMVNNSRLAMARAVFSPVMKGFSGVEDASTRFGTWARELGLASRTGAFHGGGFGGLGIGPGTRDIGDARGSGAFKGGDGVADLVNPWEFFRSNYSKYGYSPEESVSIASHYRQGMAFRERFQRVDFEALANAGVDASSVGSFRAMQRFGLGDRETNPLPWAALAQRQGLEGPAISRYLEMITQNTQAMAMRGVRIDQQEMFDILKAASVTPGLTGLGERGPAALASLGDEVASIRTEALAPYRKALRAQLWQAAFKGADGTPEGLIESIDRLESSPGAQLAAVQRGPAATLMKRSVMPHLTMEEARVFDIDALKDGDSWRGKGSRDTLAGPESAMESRFGRGLLDWIKIPGFKDMVAQRNTVDPSVAETSQKWSAASDMWPAMATRGISELFRNTQATERLNSRIEDLTRAIEALPR